MLQSFHTDEEGGVDIIKQVVKRPKVRRKSRKFVSSSTGLVDRVREMVEQCREEERGQEDGEGTMVENMSVLNMMQVIVGFIL